MSEKSSIEWCDSTWNVVRGCSRVSPGCENCYAERFAARFSAQGQPYYGLALISALSGKPRWTGKVRLIHARLADPLRWRRPRRVFVNSMSDLFHEWLTNEEIAAVFGVMAAAPRHTFQVLTKRADRMRDWFRWAADRKPGDWTPTGAVVAAALEVPEVRPHLRIPDFAPTWPLPNVWLGVSVEDQQRADERIPLLLETPAAVRFVSAEPLLGSVDLRPWLGNVVGYEARPGGSVGIDAFTVRPGLDWVIVGGESGHGARPFDIEWAARIAWECAQARTPCFVKQLGASRYYLGTPIPLRSKKGNDPAEWPEGLRVREFPEERTR